MCKKILKKPVALPCGCTVCGSHLEIKTKTLKCVPCDIEHNLNEITCMPNKTIEKMLSQGVHLSDEEKSFRQKLEESLADLHFFGDELRAKHSLLEVAIYDHFVELRRQLDLRSEEAKLQIDTIHMEMIEASKKMQAEYMDYLTSTTLSRREDSLDEERNALEDMFRDMHLSMQSVKDMAERQSKAIGEIKHKLGELEAIAELVKKNEFTSGDVLSKQLFGQLHLVSSLQRSPDVVSRKGILCSYKIKCIP